MMPIVYQVPSGRTADIDFTGFILAEALEEESVGAILLADLELSNLEVARCWFHEKIEFAGWEGESLSEVAEDVGAVEAG